jgi:hypothetical protein
MESVRVTRRYTGECADRKVERLSGAQRDMRSFMAVINKVQSRNTQRKVHRSTHLSNQYTPPRNAFWENGALLIHSKSVSIILLANAGPRLTHRR